MTATAAAEATAPPIPPPEPETTADNSRPRRWTVEEFFRAARLGLFRPDERLELLSGEIIEKMTQNPPHAVALNKSIPVFSRVIAGQDCHLRVQAPLALSDDSAPEPDIAVIAGSPDNYATKHPAPGDVLLLVEISDATLHLDRRRKAALYAAAGINEYWILNLIDRRLEVHRDPSNGAYQVITLLGETQTISPLAAPQATLRVADLLPAP